MTAIDLRLGDWRDVLADVEPDCVIADPPYSERTHGALAHASRAERDIPDPSKATHAVPYAAWSDAEMVAFCEHWSPRTRGWMVLITDHTLGRVAEQALQEAGRYVFAPLPLVEVGSRVRLAGDGPSSWTCWVIIAARPSSREFSRWGTLPGAYVYSGKGDRVMIGGKSTTAMRAIVRDYSLPNDLVCDPTAGAGTGLIAAAIEGRRAVGAELDPVTHAKAMKRIAKGYTPTMFHESAAQAEQEELDLCSR